MKKETKRMREVLRKCLFSPFCGTLFLVCFIISPYLVKEERNEINQMPRQTKHKWKKIFSVRYTAQNAFQLNNLRL